MRIRPSNQVGGVLVISVCTLGVLSVILASYLNYTSHEGIASRRSQAWNLALGVAEAGIEEALSHIYSVSQSNSIGSVNFAQNGWGQVGSQYTKSLTLGTAYYDALIYLSNSSPVIESRGFYPLPGTTSYISRVVRVTTTNSAVLTKAVSVIQSIDMSGNNVTIDSFDSSKTNYSTGGNYDPAKRKDGGDVATTSGIANAINVGNADIYGKVDTGPNGSISVGPNGAVGSLSWLNGGHSGIQPGWSADDMNVAFTDVQAPFNGGAFTPGGGLLGLVGYTYILNSGNYQLSSLSMSGSQQMIVTGNAVLYVTGNVSLSGNAQITLAPGASLKLYVGGSSASIGGNGIAGPTNAANFYLYGLPTNTSIDLKGNAAFTGVVYAPEAAVSMGGGGNNTYDFVGSVIAKSLSLNGHFNIHFDEDLMRTGPSRGYLVVNWLEI
jgi:Tfp pilus assembly protein PilX